MKKTNIKSQSELGVSYGFKITVVILIFILTAVRLLSVIYFPSYEIVPARVFLFIILSILFYLWIQELIDFHRLLKINQELRTAHEQLKDAEIDTVAALINAEEAKDLYTRGHSVRVRKLALAIAEAMDLNQEKKIVINRAGILHDIGKIGLSDAILNKKEKLTDAEREIIKKHPENAMPILEPLKFLTLERDVILQHHERYDGGGYPNGLKGGQICLEALIIAVADAFDAMNSKRAYREALSEDNIIAELEKSRGNQHSEEVINVFLALLKKNPQFWER